MLWRVAEDLTSVNHEYRKKVQKINAEKRQVELIGEFHLLQYLNLEAQLSYLENGKPVLTSGFISITHHANLVAFMIGKEPIGLDLQDANEKIARIARRFCNEGELASAQSQDDPLEFLTLVWSAKESIFKIYGQDLPFAEGMTVYRNGAFGLKCEVHDGSIYELGWERIGNAFLVYSLGKLAAPMG